jgi:hypothetical protein
MSRKSECGCAIDIHIDNRGDVHVYNCTTPGAPDLRRRVTAEMACGRWTVPKPIIGDRIGLSAVELATLTSANLSPPSRHSTRPRTTSA